MLFYFILFYFIHLFLSVGLYVFYLFYLFILFIVLFLSFILFYFIYLFTYLLLIYFFVCGAVNVRVWMSRLQFCILNEYECVAIYIFIFNTRIAHTARAPPGLLFFDHLSVISRGSNGTTAVMIYLPGLRTGEV